MYKNLKKKTEGFTIIEVLIVLAIAGLILLVVFLAVPALQRNSRNTQRRNQVASYLGAVNEFVANNNGRVPVTADIGTVNDLSADGPLSEPTAVVTGDQSNPDDVDSMTLVTQARCDGTSGDAVAGANRAFVVLFSVEDSTGGAVPQCQAS